MEARRADYAANHCDAGPGRAPAGEKAGHPPPRVSVVDPTGVVVHRSRHGRRPRGDEGAAAGGGGGGTSRKAAGPAPGRRRDRAPAPRGDGGPPPAFSAVVRDSVVCNFVDPAQPRHNRGSPSPPPPEVEPLHHHHHHHQQQQQQQQQPQRCKREDQPAQRPQKQERWPPHHKHDEQREAPRQCRHEQPPAAPAVPPPPPPSGSDVGAAVETEVREVKRMLRSFMAKLSPHRASHLSSSHELAVTSAHITRVYGPYSRVLRIEHPCLRAANAGNVHVS